MIRWFELLVLAFQLWVERRLRRRFNLLRGPVDFDDSVPGHPPHGKLVPAKEPPEVI